ncbi:MAG: ABC transporter substrate-binding protein [Pseudonocardia sediminis]
MARVRAVLLRGIAAAALLLTTVACAGGPSAPAPAGPAPDGAAFPVSVPHAFGSTTVTAPALRVVALGVTDADPLLALGITPVAVTGYSFYPSGLGPWAQSRVQGPQPVRLASDSTPALEQIAALTPDLIVAVSSGIDQPTYDRLSRIAPTIARPADTAAYTVARAAATTTIATALGRATDGAELNRRADAAFASARSARPEFAGRTGSVVLPFDGRYGVFTPGDARGRFLAELGFVQPPRLAGREGGQSYFLDVAREEVGALDGDVLVMLADQPALRQAVESDQVLGQVPVVAQNRMLITDTDTRGAMTYNSVLSVPYALDRLVPALASAVR